MAGTLYLVPTPIGNLGDISQRMADTLAQADFIAAEDTRVSIKLLNHLGLKKPMVSYHRHNTDSGGRAVLDRLLSGRELRPGDRRRDARHLRPRRGAGGPVRRPGDPGVSHPWSLCPGSRSGGLRPAHRPLHL